MRPTWFTARMNRIPWGYAREVNPPARVTRSANRSVLVRSEYVPGERTGKFRLGKDELIANSAQESRISMEDYAVALVDELEKPRHRRQRFSVGY